MNPIFQQMNGQSNIGQMMKQFQQFKSGFQGNPQAMIQEMLRSGRITQAQYDEAVRLANQLSQFMR